MEYRSGTCSSCGAEYQIPASFPHDVARCKACQGVVRLDPLSEEATPAPVAPVATEAPEPSQPADEPESKPSEAFSAPEPSVEPVAEEAVTPAPMQTQAEPAEVESRLMKGQGSTLARLRTERAAAQDDKPAAAPPAKKPLAAKPASTKRSGRPGAAAGESSKTAAGSVKRSTARKGKSGAGRARARPAKKKKSPIPMMAGLLLVIGLAAGAYFFGGDLFGSAKGQGSEVAAQEVEAPVEETMDPGAQAQASDDGAAAAPEDETPEIDPFADEEQAQKPKAVANPASVDLSLIADFGPVDDTTDAEWSAMEQSMEVWMDVDAGAAGNRAKGKLLASKRKAFPVILNHFKTLDLASPNGRSNGDQCQRALMDICNGYNFGWKYEDTPEDVLWNKKVVRLWATQWERAQGNVLYWIKMAKLEEKDPSEAKRLKAAFGDATDLMGGAEDDLDID